MPASCSRRRSSAARRRTGPNRWTWPNPSRVPRLIHGFDGETFVNDPFEPAPLAGVPPDGTELLALDEAEGDLWAVGGGAASGSSAPPSGSVPRPPIALRLVGSVFKELPLDPKAFGSTDRFGDVAAVPGAEEAFATVVPFAERRSVNSKATVARIKADGTATLTRLPAAGSGRGSAARIACPAPTECWMATWGGWLFHYTDGAALDRDTDPAFQGTIEFRPNESAEQFVPDRLPVDDSQLFAPPELPLTEEAAKKAKVKRLPPLLRRVRSRLQGLRLSISFTLARRARVQLLAKRGERTVARTPNRVLRPGRRTLTLALSRESYPTGLKFRIKEVGRR